MRHRIWEDPWEDYKKFLRVWWCGLLTMIMGSTFFDEERIAKNLAVFKSITCWMVAQDLLLLVIVVCATIALAKMHPIFKWSLFSLLPKNSSVAQNGMNVALIPLTVKYFGFIFAAILVINLPSMAGQEEQLFREGTIGWVEGAYMSLAFGMIHCSMGVPIGAGLAISIVGLWYTHQYFVGGVELSTVHHTTFNLIVVSILILGMILQHIVDLLPPLDEKED